ncbi:MAG TPA: DegT/DnrJ/EryC1/StrS family aminotransferase [bacterium]|nr:DegT/DnrJ/EryC1/StrS family aminotransferase [bacterium]
MNTNPLSRRTFLRRSSLGLAGLALAGHSARTLAASIHANNTSPAVLGGTPVRTAPFPSWPVWNTSAEEDILDILRSGDWYRGRGETVSTFEEQYADLMGAKRCLATASGTTALLVALHVLGIDAGDEVLVPPYTFIATYNVVFWTKALPVFVDTDPETFTMNPDKIEERITDRTRAILPVHILGLPAEMDKINAIAEKHNLVVIEDACQAWLAEYQGKKCGTLADLGCFSFQNSKHLPSGEGGAILGEDDAIMDRCHAFHNCGRPHGIMPRTSTYPMRGTNYRMTEMQAGILLSQMQRIQRDADRRWENALYLTSQIENIPGVLPYKLTRGATRSAYHLYPFRYKKAFFHDLPREKFLDALRAEGIPCSGGYGPQNKDGLIEEALSSRGFKRLFSEQRLQQYREQNHCPDNDQLCQEAVWFSQRMLLGPRRDMDDIANALRKIHEHAEQLAQA